MGYQYQISTGSPDDPYHVYNKEINTSSYDDPVPYMHWYQHGYVKFYCKQITAISPLRGGMLSVQPQIRPVVPP